MDFTAFSSEMEKRGCCVSDKIFCGTYQGRPFHVIFLDGKTNGATRFQIFMTYDKIVNKTMYKNISKALKGICKINTPKNTPHLFMNVTIKDNASFSQSFDRLLSAIDEEAGAEGYGIPTICTVCSQSGPDSFAYYNSQYVSVHKACIEKNTSDKVAKIQDNEMNASYLLGFIGALLGGIVGCIPSVLLIVFASRISGWLCALIPLGAYLGYKLFKGKMNRAALFITIFISILMVPVLNYLSNALYIYKEYAYFISISEYITALTEEFANFIPELGQSALFIIIGIAIVSSIISRGNRHYHAEANFTWNSIRPIQHSAQQPQYQQQPPAQTQPPFQA